MSDATAVTPGLLNIGEEAKPPAVVRPDPVLTFLNRARRLEKLAENHALGDYLKLVAAICRAQADVQTDLPPLHGSGVTGTVSGSPPLQPDTVHLDASEDIFSRLATALQAVDGPEPFKQTLRAILALAPTQRRLLLAEALAWQTAAEDPATLALAYAALQVHFARLAAKLDVDAIELQSEPGRCPACGSPPVASAVVNWPQANNTRFCTCSLCATQWHVVRLKCVSCGTTAGMSYPHIEGHSDSLRAETCDACKSYVKIVYQVKDPVIEPFADDVASLDLDMVLKAEGWKRGGRNPFLLGY
jgi:FdhE protein